MYGIGSQPQLQMGSEDLVEDLLGSTYVENGDMYKFCFKNLCIDSRVVVPKRSHSVPSPLARTADIAGAEQFEHELRIISEARETASDETPFVEEESLSEQTHEGSESETVVVEQSQPFGQQEFFSEQAHDMAESEAAVAWDDMTDGEETDRGEDDSLGEQTYAWAEGAWAESGAKAVGESWSVGQMTHLEGGDWFGEQAQAASEQKQEQEQVVTYMVRNVPCRVTKRAMEAELIKLGFYGTYDYVHFPTRRNGSGLGFGFVNFVTPEYAEQFKRAFDGHTFAHSRSAKQCFVSPADVQGLEANLNQFKRYSYGRSASDRWAWD
eukprot:TRINITY_DN71760_c0_g1_i1.p1 TRINITY_DN71760_c0_g1~~TRINITY_DN71760_c0_g1_i1.p1  ORF type:complete len:356 (-),score=110.15 TRINITY_DN71760_c0_g1_i1:47-1018(-)